MGGSVELVAPPKRETAEKGKRLSACADTKTQTKIGSFPNPL